MVGGLSQLVNRGTFERLSFSLCAVIAEGGIAEQKARASLARGTRGNAFLQCTGGRGRSGCTPAEPYPPSRTDKIRDEPHPHQTQMRIFQTSELTNHIPEFFKHPS